MAINILTRLRSNTQSLSPKLQIIARYIQDNVQNNAQDLLIQTITDLARHSKTSEASVIRFCRDLGFQGYSSFKMALAIELTQNNQPAQHDKQKSDIGQLSTQSAITALQDTENLLSRAQLTQILLLIDQAQQINCIGVGASAIVGQYLTYRLLRIGKQSTMYHDTHLATMCAATCDKTTLWFAISSYGSTREVIHAMTQAHKRNVPIVTLTNINLSPLASISSHILVAAKPESPLTGGAFDSKVGVLLLVDIIINSLLEHYPHYQQQIKETAMATAPLII